MSALGDLVVWVLGSSLGSVGGVLERERRMLIIGH